MKNGMMKNIHVGIGNLVPKQEIQKCSFLT